MAAFVNDYYRSKGVEVLDGELVAGIEREGDGFRVATEAGQSVEADEVVAGLGIVPNRDLAEAAGLEVDDGIVVDDRGRAGGREDVFAAGDVARFPVPALGGLRRVEHEDHANSHGRHVGANMAGADAPYDHLPFFYSSISSTSATRPSATSTPASTRSLSGRSRTARAWSATSRAASLAASFSGTCGTRSTPPARSSLRATRLAGNAARPARRLVVEDEGR